MSGMDSVVDEKITFIYLCSEVFVGFLSVAINFIVLVSIVNHPSIHTAPNVFIANLALADIAVGLVVPPLTAYSWFGYPANFGGCLMLHSVMIAITNVSVLMLLAIALERFLAIKAPFFYHQKMTLHKAYLANFLVWVLGFLLGTVPLLWNTGYHELEKCQFLEVIHVEFLVYFQFPVMVLTPLLIISSIYMYIGVIVRRHVQLQMGLQAQLDFNDQLTDAAGSSQKRGPAARSFAGVVCFFVVLWVPVYILITLIVYCPDSCPYPFEALLVTIVMSHMNSSVNPFLYAMSNSQIYTAINRTLCLDNDDDADSSHRSKSIRSLSRFSMMINRADVPGLPALSNDQPIPRHRSTRVSFAGKFNGGRLTTTDVSSTPSKPMTTSSATPTSG